MVVDESGGGARRVGEGRGEEGLQCLWMLMEVAFCAVQSKKQPNFITKFINQIYFTTRPMVIP